MLQKVNSTLVMVRMKISNELYTNTVIRILGSQFFVKKQFKKIENTWKSTKKLKLTHF